MSKFLFLALAGRDRLFLLLITAMPLVSLNAFAKRADNVPKEGKVFYTENISGTRAESEYGDWQLTSYVVNCFDEERVKNKEYAWLMTADGETQLAVTLNYYGNDPVYKIASQEVEFYWYEGSNDLFKDDNKTKITEISERVGHVETQTTANSASVFLTAPSAYPFYNSPYYTFYVVIKINFENGGSAAVAKNIGISRPGVILLHGLFANYDDKNLEKRTFYHFQKYLLDSEVYFPAQVYCGNYHEYNTDSFFDNTHVNNVVGECLKDISKNLFDYGIASTKYDMIGHSMGGILERLYNQEVDNRHTNKLITLNTPHFGSGWGNAGKAVINSLKASYPQLYPLIISAQYDYQAIWDLSINSSAIQNLNSSVKSQYLNNIPVCAVGSRVDLTRQVSDGISNKISKVLDLNEIESFLLAYLTAKGTEEVVGDIEIGDAVVSVDSQRGGLSSAHSHIYSGDFGDAWHSGSPKWYVIHDKLIQLLKTTSKDEFSLNGFGTTPTADKSRNGSREGDIPTEFITEFEQPLESSFIKITVEEVNNGDYTHKIVLSHSADLERIVAFAKLSDNEAIMDYGKDEMHFDLSGYDQEITIYAIGRTDYNAFVADSIKVKLGEGTGIADVYTSNIQYSMNGQNLIIQNLNEPYEITVCDMAGRTLISQKNNPSHTYTLPDWSSVLIVRIKTKDDVQTFKVLPFAEKSQE